jgi:hypothetical protein
VAGVLEQRRDALAQQRVVIGDHDAKRLRRLGLLGCNVV